MANNQKIKSYLFVFLIIIVVMGIAILAIRILSNGNQNKIQTQNVEDEINFCTQDRDQEIIDIVMEQPKVKEFFGQTFPEGNKAVVEVNSKLEDVILVQVYELVLDSETGVTHTATFDWYYFNCDGEITGTMMNQ